LLALEKDHGVDDMVQEVVSVFDLGVSGAGLAHECSSLPIDDEGQGLGQLMSISVKDVAESPALHPSEKGTNAGQVLLEVRSTAGRRVQGV
jgi:hypothetical protein